MTGSTIGRSAQGARVAAFIAPLCRALGICLLGAPLCAAANALDPIRHISQYGHTVWRVQDGAVDPTGAITQTADGYLWLATSNGLLRFDGVKFVPLNPPGLNLPTRGFTFLLGARDGSLWIGMRRGLSRLKDGRLQVYTKPDDHSGISTILEDHEGTIWVTRYSVPRGEGPLCRVEGNGLHCYGEADGIPVRYGLGLTEDKSGNIWFGSSVLCRWREGSSSTYLNEIRKHQDAGNGVSDVAAGSSGEIWAAVDGVGQDLGIRHFSGGKWSAYVIPGLDGTKVLSHAIFVDRKQSLWIGTEHDGLYRVRDGIADHYRSADGLSGDSVGQFYEDHEGNIWVVTAGGLDMFRDTPVVSYSMREGLSAAGTYSILALHDDSVWTGNEGAVDILNRGRHSLLPGKELSGSSVKALFQDRHGVVWLGVGGNLMTYEHGRLQKIQSLGESDITAIGEDTNQNLWALTSRHHLFRIRDRIAHEVMSVSTDAPRTGFLAPDREGGIWIGGRDGPLTHYHDGNVHTMALEGFDSSSSVYGLLVDSDNSLLVLTTRGLFRWNGHGWDLLDSRNGLPCDVIYSALKDDDEALWLYSQCGLVKVARSELDRWHQQKDSRLAVEIFDQFDGAHSAAPAQANQPVASKTPDGRLWFINIVSAQMIDPKQTHRNPLPPPVRIEKVIVNHKDYAFDDRVRLPALTRDVEIDYTALSLTVPPKVHFRYELEGHDAAWQEAGTRRQAFYTNLSPGNYRFRVMACNNSGVWNEDGTFLDFSIAPAYYQTTWFRLSCVAALAVLLWGLYLLRLRGIERRYRERKQAAEALRQAQADLTRANRMSSLGELTASLAHEVKQPIAATITNAGTCLRWLSHDQPDLEKARAAALRIEQDGRRASEIINRVRLLFEKDSLQRELVDLNEIVREMMRLLHNEATEFAVLVRTELAADLPQVMGDRVQLQQVLMNLMMNGIDAMKDIEGRRELTIESQRGENGEVLISVSDTGVGLPPQQADKIFDAFFTTKTHGTGMGLRISRSIVESHGGRLWASDNSPRGATFQFTLPAKVAAPA
jgi:signal transduction histidine kinase/ligand-binding sensor domain-containing protein